MGHEGEVWPTSDADFYRHLVKQERCFEPIQDVRERKLCVDWIVRACTEYGFRADVPAAATRYFDELIAYARSLPSSQGLKFKPMVVTLASRKLDTQAHKESAICELICIICISIAAKKLEPKAKAPFLGDFEDHYTFAELRNMETLVLDALQWDLSSCTAIDFIHHWLPRIPLEDPCQRRKMQEHSERCVHKCLGEAEFAKMRPSIIGAAATLWGHAAMNLDFKKWEEDLLTLVDFTVDEVSPVVETMAELLSDEYPDAYHALSRRSCSPLSVLNMTTEFRKLPGVKRPTPERACLPDSKKGRLG